MPIYLEINVDNLFHENPQFLSVRQTFAWDASSQASELNAQPNGPRHCRNDEIMWHPDPSLFAETDRLRVLPLAVTRAESIAELIGSVGSDDVLVNNAGVVGVGAFEAKPMSGGSPPRRSYLRNSCDTRGDGEHRAAKLRVGAAG